MAKQAFVIAIEPSADLQREQVHELVKRHADSWWHSMADIWIVLGKTAGDWKDLIGPIFPNDDSGKLLVLKVDNDRAVSSWSFRGKFPESSKTWLRESLKAD